MIVGLGTDLVDMTRMAQAVARSKSFVDKILTPDEKALYEALPPHRQLEFISGRFAAKEALSKALGTGIGALTFQDMAVLYNERHKPIMTCSKYAGPIFVSITHESDFALATVVLEEE